MTLDKQQLKNDFRYFSSGITSTIIFTILAYLWLMPNSYPQVSVIFSILSGLSAGLFAHFFQKEFAPSLKKRYLEEDGNDD